MNGQIFDRRTFVGLAGTTAIGLMLLGRGSNASATRFAVSHMPQEWKKLLGPQRYRILREAGTEVLFA